MDPKQNQSEEGDSTSVITIEDDSANDQDDGQNLEQDDDQRLEEDDQNPDLEDPKDKGKADDEEEDLGVEVVFASSDDDPKEPKGKNFGKRIRKMNERIEVAEQGKETANTELQTAKDQIAQLENQNKIQALALTKKEDVPDPNAPPDPDKFDAGEYDPEYRRQMNAYHDSRNDARVNKLFDTKLEEADKSARQNQVDNAKDYALEQKQEIHYERALNMGIKKQDYFDTEDKVVAVLGKRAVNTMIKSIPDAHKALYFLGKNPERLEQISESLQADAVRGIYDVSVLNSKLSINKITKAARDPDRELEGGTPASPKKKRGPPGSSYS